MSVVGGGANGSDQVHFEMDVVGTLVDEMQRLGIATPEELDVATLAERVIDEMTATGSVVVGRSEVGAWARV